MRHVRETLRLTGSGVSKREIARRLGVAPSTVRETLRRFADAELSWLVSGIFAEFRQIFHLSRCSNLASHLLN